MSSVLVLYYSSFGHIEAMAHAQAEGAGGVVGTRVVDQTGALWAKGALVGKVGSVFCSTASQHGGQETTITSFHSTLLHHGMIIIGLPYTFQGLATLREVTGGTPYGASCITGTGPELRMPTALELEMGRYQGEHVAKITRRLLNGAGAESFRVPRSWYPLSVDGWSSDIPIACVAGGEALIPGILSAFIAARYQ